MVLALLTCDVLCSTCCKSQKNGNQALVAGRREKETRLSKGEDKEMARFPEKGLEKCFPRALATLLDIEEDSMVLYAAAMKSTQLSEN